MEAVPSPFGSIGAGIRVQRRESSLVAPALPGSGQLSGVGPPAANAAKCPVSALCETHQLMINHKSAHTIGLTKAPAMPFQADEVNT
jgi:hypothetical protein